MKIYLRQIYQQKRVNCRTDVHKISELMKSNIPSLLGAQVLSIFYPLPGELDCLSLGRELKKNYKLSLALPIVSDQSKVLQFSLFDEATQLVPGRFKILEPQIKNYKVPDLVIVPLLAFDPLSKQRLGYGGGYYDSTMSFYRQSGKACLFVGLGHEELICKGLPHEKHDQPLDLVVTNERVY